MKAHGRTRKPTAPVSGKKKRRHVSIPPELDTRLMKASSRTGIPISTLVAQALRLRLAELEAA